MGSEKDKTPSQGGVDWQHPARGIVRIKDHETGVVEEFLPDGLTPRKKIAIVGYATSCRDQAPFHDPEWSIWGLNQLYRLIPRADRWFEIHHNWNEHTVEADDSKYIEWLSQAPIPTYMAVRQPHIPNSVNYPMARMRAKFGDPNNPHTFPYGTSTIAWMVALAIDEIDRLVEREVAAKGWMVKDGESPVKFLERLYGGYAIGIWGVDLIVGTEYFHQKACAEFYIGQASARGIRVALPVETALCKQSHAYGFEKGPQSWPLSSNEIIAHRAKLSADRDNVMRQLYAIDGALQADEYWMGLAEIRERNGRYA